MSLKPDDLAQIILDSIDDDEPPTALYTLNIHEARMLAHAVLNVARLGQTADDPRDTPAGQHHDSRPWEPLAPGDPLHVGDEVRREWGGVSTRGTVGVQHSDLQVYTAGRRHLGHRGVGTWYVRRPVQELPTGPGAVIVPADGREYVEAAFFGETYHAREAMLSGELWHAVWRTAHGDRVRHSLLPEDITPGTWKAECE